MICWVDLETSGLEPTEGSILEVAVVVTDDNLNEIAEPFVALVRPLDGRGYEVMNDFVKTMHTKNGLLDEIYSDVQGAVVREGVEQPSAVDGQIVDYIKTLTAFHHEPGEGETYPEHVFKILRKTPLGGSSVHFDKAWLKAHMPAFEGLFSHRLCDVSALNEFASRWTPAHHAHRPGLDANGKPLPAHRALDDIRASIRTAKFYREMLFHVDGRYVPVALGSTNLSASTEAP